MEREPSNIEREEAPYLLEIPEIPYKGLGRELQTEEGPSSEAWQQWIDFARSEFVMTFLWSNLENKRVRLEIDKDRPDYNKETEAIFEKEYIEWQERFFHLADNTLTPDMAKPGDNPMVGGLTWWNNNVDTAAIIINNTLRKPEEREALEANIHSRDELFDYFIRPNLERHTNAMSERFGMPAEKYWSMLHSNWEVDNQER